MLNDSSLHKILEEYYNFKKAFIDNLIPDNSFQIHTNSLQGQNTQPNNTQANITQPNNNLLKMKRKEPEKNNRSEKHDKSDKHNILEFKKANLTHLQRLKSLKNKLSEPIT